MQTDLIGPATTFLLLLLQLPAVAILLSRLLRGPTRRPPLKPRPASPDQAQTVSIVVPTLNEAERISPCLVGLAQQGPEVREIIVVDSRSKDGTQDLVKTAALNDPRFQLMEDQPLPSDWVGRPWALDSGFRASDEASEWVLGVDADTMPQPGLVASLLNAAQTGGYDLISLSPQFVLKYPGELWLQPALLMTLVYRFGPAGERDPSADRVMANGQCFLCRRSLLVDLGGYSSARRSFCDDVTLARNAARLGAKVGFLDGAEVLKVRMYEGMKETWTEWGRSLDLKDAASKGQVWGDLWFLTMVQALPLPLTLLGIVCFFDGGANWFDLSTWQGPLNDPTLRMEWVSFGLNGFLLLMRFALGLAIAPSYDRTKAQGSWLFWLSPLADPLAVLRIYLSSLRQPKQWRGRTYG
jgi:dolichol-phosphate mannosyltransferase